MTTTVLYYTPDKIATGENELVTYYGSDPASLPARSSIVKLNMYVENMTTNDVNFSVGTDDNHNFALPAGAGVTSTGLMSEGKAYTVGGLSKLYDSTVDLCLFSSGACTGTFYVSVTYTS
jgi:hypothetical protein